MLASPNLIVFVLVPSLAHTTNFFLPYPGSPLRILLGLLIAKPLRLHPVTF